MSKKLGLVLDGHGYDYAKTVLSYYLREGGAKDGQKVLKFQHKG